MNDANWIARALRDAGASSENAPHVDVADRVLRTLADGPPPDALAPTRSAWMAALVGCLIAGATVAYAADAWLAASDPLGAALSPVRLTLTDG